MYNRYNKLVLKKHLSTCKEAVEHNVSGKNSLVSIAQEPERKVVYYKVKTIKLNAIYYASNNKQAVLSNSSCLLLMRQNFSGGHIPLKYLGLLLSNQTVQENDSFHAKN